MEPGLAWNGMNICVELVTYVYDNFLKFNAHSLSNWQKHGNQLFVHAVNFNLSGLILILSFCLQNRN